MMMQTKMGKVWCAHLPVVTVPQRDTPKPLTLIYPFYENHRFFAQQMAQWRQFPAWIRQHLSLIVVDDGSPQPLELPADPPFPMRLFRIDVDCRWNWLAARNIGFHYAPEGWCLVTDMDHVLTAETAQSLILGEHDCGTIYGLSRVEHDGTPLAPHPNSWLIKRDMFWTVGGYDEALSGLYGTDGDWRRRCAATAPMAILAERLIRHEHIGDSSTTGYQRKQPQDARVKAIIAARPKKGWHPKTLTFPYKEVTCAHSTA